MTYRILLAVEVERLGIAPTHRGVFGNKYLQEVGLYAVFPVGIVLVCPCKIDRITVGTETGRARI